MERLGREIALLALLIAVCWAIPGLDRGSPRWPFDLAAVSFAVYGLAVFAYARAHRRAYEGTGDGPPQVVATLLAAMGVVLGLLTVVLLLLD
ncbi:MAG: hypothetical protein JSS68_14205 [Actinobacteria bacterium]|nr:hypothetical protein [Actinomycetota bacterium]MBS1885003.1 hypothetical protein [Actinomycetota bacterium]